MALRNLMCLGIMMLVLIQDSTAWRKFSHHEPILRYQNGPAYNKVGRERRCVLEPDSGPCRRPRIRYYFNIKTGSCAAFYFGGCHGNANNFASRGDCENKCEVGCPDGSNPLDVTWCAKKGCPDGYTCNTDDVSYGVCCPVPECPNGLPSVGTCTTPGEACGSPIHGLCVTLSDENVCCPSCPEDTVVSPDPAVMCSSAPDTCSDGETCTTLLPSLNICCLDPVQEHTCSSDGSLSAVSDCTVDEPCPTVDGTICIALNSGGQVCCPLPECPNGLPSVRTCTTPGEACGSPMRGLCVTLSDENVCCPSCPKDTEVSPDPAVMCSSPPDTCSDGETCTTLLPSLNICCPDGQSCPFGQIRIDTDCPSGNECPEGTTCINGFCCRALG